MIHINDERYSADWGHIDLIQDPIEQIFGSRLFTPLDKEILFPNRWLEREREREEGGGGENPCYVITFCT